MPLFILYSFLSSPDFQFVCLGLKRFSFIMTLLCLFYLSCVITNYYIKNKESFLIFLRMLDKRINIECFICISFVSIYNNKKTNFILM